MAVFSLIALLALLGGMALVSLRPWEDDSLAPRIAIPPGIGIGIDDSVAVARGRHAGEGAAGAAVAGVAKATFVAAPAPATGRHAVPALGISQARPAGQAIARPVPASPRPAPQSPQPLPGPVAPAAEPVAIAMQPPAPPAPVLVANFEEGLRGWSASVGDVFPAIVSGIVRDGSRASAVRLAGSQSGSQLIFGNAEGWAVQIQEGDTLAFGFSFYIQSMAYGRPGADNLIMRFGNEGSEGHAFGLQLWDPAAGTQVGARGLWASGEAMGGDRFLAAVPERTWHDIAIDFVASSQGLGSYQLYLDGEPIDARNGVSIIPPGADYVQIEVGLLRDADLVRGTSEIRIDAAQLADSVTAIQP